jgi:hypothetical protein
MKSNFILGGLCVILIISHAIATRSCSGAREENARLTANQTALLEDAVFYRTKDSLSAASVQQLTLTAVEYEKHFAELNRLNAELSIRAKRLESASMTATQTVNNIIVAWRDSIVYMPGTVDTLRSVSYNDGYLAFSAVDRGDVLDTHIAIRDTLVQFVHRVPRRFLCFRFGTKAIRQEVISKNPYSRIVYTEYIRVGK